VEGYFGAIFSRYAENICISLMYYSRAFISCMTYMIWLSSQTWPNLMRYWLVLLHTLPSSSLEGVDKVDDQESSTQVPCYECRPFLPIV